MKVKRWERLTVKECKERGIRPEDIRPASLHETPIGNNPKKGFMLQYSKTGARPVCFKNQNQN